MDLGYIATKPGVSGAAAEMFDLQVAQFRHDEFYHREIARLTVHARLNHMALHFCKYVGQLAEAVAAFDQSKIQRTIVDAFLIDLCAANALNIRLSDFVLSVEDCSPSLVGFADGLVRSAPIIERNGQWLITAFATDAGKIARACEKIDHLEAFPFRESIVSALGSIGRLSLLAAHAQGFQLVPGVRKRLLEVEEKYFFHNAL